jgi:hypothetical protein
MDEPMPSSTAASSAPRCAAYAANCGCKSAPVPLLGLVDTALPSQNDPEVNIDLRR